jgi:hypothetical protein
MATLPKVSFTLSSDTSRAQPMVRFALRCALFFAPLAAVVALAAAVLSIVGELMPAERVLELQKSAPVLYDPMYQPKSAYPAYKLLGTSKRHPEVLALGTSRILELRNEFVRESGPRFYNGYMYSAPIGAMRGFLEHLPPGQLPHVLILDIDPWWFRDRAQIEPEPGYFEPSSRLQIIDFAWRNGLYLTTQRWALFASPNLIGGSARLNGSGLRADGSLFLERRFFDEVPNLLQRQLQDVRDGADTRLLRGSTGLSQDAIEEMQRLLSYCSSHHILLIGYLSSYHPALYDALKSDPRQAYIWRIAPVLARLFQEKGAVFFDLQDPAAIGCGAAEYLDVGHESDVCTAKAVIAMASRDSRAAAVFDAGKLEGFLNHRRSDWQLGF